MKILRTYILRECAGPFGLALCVLTCVFLLGNLIQLTHLVINKGVSLVTIAKVFWLYIPLLLGYTLPIACLVGIMLAFGRLSADNEILAIRAAGIHLSRLLAPLAMVGLILSGVTFLLMDRVIPYAHFEQRKLLKQLGSQNPTALLEPGVFIHSFEGVILFFHKIEDNVLSNVTIYLPQPDGKPTRTIIARKGEFTRVPGKEEILLKLMDGNMSEPDTNNPLSFTKLDFRNYFKPLIVSQKDKKIDKKPKNMTLKELRQEIERMETLLIDSSRFQTEYYRKIAWSFSPFLFVLLGFPMAVITNKRAKTANVILAIFIAAGYYLLSLGCEALSIEKVAPPAVLMMLPNIIYGLLIFFFNIRLLRS